jgi:TRAP-type C4-dicarboxylate transport system substrate-binding protein
MEVENEKAVKILKEKGVTLHNFSKEDRAKFREAAMKSWDSCKTKTPEAKLLVESHVAYMKKINLIK